MSRLFTKLKKKAAQKSQEQPVPKTIKPKPRVGRAAPVVDSRAVVNDMRARLVEAAQVGREAAARISPEDARPPYEVLKSDDQPIDRLTLGKSVTKALIRAGFETIGDLREHKGEWMEFTGIGPSAEDKIVAALASYQDAPEAEAEEEVEEAEGISVSFKSLIIVDRGLTLTGLNKYKQLHASQMFEGVTDAAVVAGLRTFAEFDHVVLIVDTTATYMETLYSLAEKYHIPCITEVSF